MQHHKYSLTELEEMLPWERTIYLGLLMQYLEEEKERINAQKQARRQMAKKKEETKKGLLSSIFGRKEKKKEKKKETSPTKEGVEQKTEEPTVGSNVLPFLDLIAKQSLAFPGKQHGLGVRAGVLFSF